MGGGEGQGGKGGGRLWGGGCKKYQNVSQGKKPVNGKQCIIRPNSS